MEKSGKIFRVLRCALAVVTLLLAGCMITQCIRIYAEFARSGSTDALSCAFTTEKVAVKFGEIRWLVWIWAALLAVTKGFEWALWSSGLLPTQYKKPKYERPTVPKFKIGAWAGGVLLAAAVVFLVIGILNGGFHGAFVKAAAICTECVGLG